jgi:hypothetical protein
MVWKPIVKPWDGAYGRSPRGLKKAGRMDQPSTSTQSERPNDHAKTRQSLMKPGLHFAEIRPGREDFPALQFKPSRKKPSTKFPTRSTGPRQHADIVNTMVFILFRSPLDRWFVFTKREKVDPFATDKERSGRVAILLWPWTTSKRYGWPILSMNLPLFLNGTANRIIEMASGKHGRF